MAVHATLTAAAVTHLVDGHRCMFQIIKKPENLFCAALACCRRCYGALPVERCAGLQSGEIVRSHVRRECFHMRSNSRRAPWTSSLLAREAQENSDWTRQHTTSKRQPEALPRPTCRSAAVVLSATSLMAGHQSAPNAPVSVETLHGSSVEHSAQEYEPADVRQSFQDYSVRPTNFT